MKVEAEEFNFACVVIIIVFIQEISLNSLKILIIDSSSFRSSAIRFLESRLKYGVLSWADTGKDALKKIELFEPNVIIVDVSLPDINGLKLITKIREKSNGVKLILITLNDYYEYEKYALSAGADDCLLKTEFGNSIIPFLTEHFGDGILKKVHEEE